MLKHFHQKPAFLRIECSFIWVGFILRKVLLCDVKMVPSHQYLDPG